jgi:VanZ family protein
LPKLTTKAFVTYWVPVITWLCVIATESLSPFAASDHTSRFVIPILHWLMPHLNFAQLTEIHEVLRKVGHFFGYGLLSFFFFRALRGTHHIYHGTENLLSRAYIRSTTYLAFANYWRIHWAILAVIGTNIVATLDELHQMTLKNRGGSWRDVLLDTIGGTIFQVAIFVFISMKSRTRRNSSEHVEV